MPSTAVAALRRSSTVLAATDWMSRARTFFEKLWWFDQIVVGASAVTGR